MECQPAATIPEVLAKVDLFQAGSERFSFSFIK